MLTFGSHSQEQVHTHTQLFVLLHQGLVQDSQIWGSSLKGAGELHAELPMHKYIGKSDVQCPRCLPGSSPERHGPSFVLCHVSLFCVDVLGTWLFDTK